MRAVAAFLLSAVLAVPGDQGERQPLRFAWPRTATATVDLLMERAVGPAFRSVEIRYRLEVVPEGDQGCLLVRLSDPQILALNRVPLRRASIDTETYDVARVLSAITPSFVVSGEGEYLEDREVDRLVRDVLAAAGFPSRPMGMSAFEDLVARVAPSDWHAWVELWIGDTLAPGDLVRTKQVVGFEGNLAHVTIVRKALAAGAPGHSRLQASAEFPSEAVRHYTVGFLLDMAVAAEELGEDVLANREFVHEARFSPVTETVTAELETDTLRPLVVERTRSFWATARSHTVDGRERRVHRFEWKDVPGDTENR